MKVIVYIATSLDGFIARENGDLDWLDAANETLGEGKDCGYEKVMAKTDVLVMGRHTYEKVLSFGSWPYTKPVIVMSSKNLDIPEVYVDAISSSTLSSKELYLHLEKQGHKYIYIDGGICIQGFLEEGLVDEIIITLIPVLLGRGKPLFARLKKDINLKQIKAYDCEYSQLRYEVIK